MIAERLGDRTGAAGTSGKERAVMQGVILPGQELVELNEFDVPAPGYGQVLVRMKASGLCGSELHTMKIFDAGKTGKVVISWED
jgi:D-arabinose 1-dehydrogenase-like Zn-dependent alcohol dehydrogenase